MCVDCHKLEQAGNSFSRSVRIQIPRMLIALYEIRNNRGVGHVGGDVDPNYMDATAVVYMCKWIMAELVRIFHAVDTDKASALVDSLIERLSPVIWKVDGKYRVLDTKITMKDKALLILHHHVEPVTESELCDWLEHSNGSVFRRDVLKKAHKDKLLEYSSETNLVRISPKGVKYIEETVIPKMS